MMSVGTWSAATCRRFFRTRAFDKTIMAATCRRLSEPWSAATCRRLSETWSAATCRRFFRTRAFDKTIMAATCRRLSEYCLGNQLAATSRRKRKRRQVGALQNTASHSKQVGAVRKRRQRWLIQKHLPGGYTFSTLFALGAFVGQLIKSKTN